MGSSFFNTNRTIDILRTGLMKYVLTPAAILTAFFSISVPQAYALNQSSNWSFTGNSTNWTVVTQTGTDVCGATTSATETALNIQAYDNNNFKAAENTISNNQQQRGRITQKITIPGTGNQNVTGGLTYSTFGTIWSTVDTSWVRLDIYDSTDATFVANVGCASFNSNVATTTIGFGNIPDVLSGGTTYTLRITQKLRNVATDGVQNLWVDNVVLTTPVVNPAASGPTNAKSAALTWDASTATTTANGLAAANGYGIYRGTTSGAETSYASSTSNSYTDTGTVGNTTYYYWITNTDTAGYESASSTEVSFLTKPDAPGTPSFSSVTDSSMTVTWTAPTGGASTYDVERCTGAACNSGWTTRSSAQAGLSFNDSGLSPSTTYGYRIVGNNATGAGVYSATGYQATGAAATAPTVSTQSASSVGQTSATLNGTIDATGGANVTVRGFAWGTNPSLSGGDTATTTDTAGQPFGTGAFTESSLTFVCNTTYYSRAYATNSAGDGLGGISASFTTSACNPPPGDAPSRRWRLFEGFRIKIISGRIILNRSQ